MTSHACFTYGSLMCEDIFAAVAGRRLAAVSAQLAGYARHPVRGEDYPGIRPAAGARLEGRLYEGIDELALARLDRFEGAEYERVAVEVSTDAGPRRAWVYVFHPEHRHRLLPGEWDFARFMASGKPRFLLRHAPDPL